MMDIEKALEKNLAEFIRGMRDCNYDPAIIRRNEAVIQDFISTKKDHIKEDLGRS